MASLFEAQAPRPLADRLRPQRLGEVVGQDHLLDPSQPLGRLLHGGRPVSMILWGPPGCGKTTIARLIARESGLHFEPLSAVFSGVADLRKVFDAAKKRRQDGQATLLFVDEIHRFNRAQQDAFLPYVEDGTVTLVGATTENPSFELNAALVSRCHVLILHRLDDAALEQMLRRAEEAEDQALPVTAEARPALRAMADGDGRHLLNMAEELFQAQPAEPLDAAGLAQAVQQRAPVYDKSQDSHFNLISALHKAMRGSDVDASLYWLARMLEGGEDPLYIARRVVRFASEDVGLADPEALVQAQQAWQTFERLGSPEGELAVAQAVVYCASAPKSNALYQAYNESRQAAKSTGSLSPPAHAMNAPTKLMREAGYSQGYEYDHNAEEGFAGLDYFPPDMARQQFYRPPERGFERDIGKRLAYWAKRRGQRQNGTDDAGR